MNKSVNQIVFLSFFTAINARNIPFRSFHRSLWWISLLFHILQLVKPWTLSISKARKWYPFWVEPPHLGHYRKCTSLGSPPPPPSSPHLANPLLLYNDILCEKVSNKKKENLGSLMVFHQKIQVLRGQITSLCLKWHPGEFIRVCINLHFVYVCFILFAFRLSGYLGIHHFFFLAKAQSTLWMGQMRDYLPGLLSIFY